MTDFLGKALLTIAIVLAGVQTWRLDTARSAEAKAVAALASYEKKAADNLTGEVITVRATEQSMQETASAVRDRTNEQADTVRAERDLLFRRLRTAEANLATAQLMSRLAGASAAGEAPSIGDGQELPARIGEADVHEAERGELVRLHLAACYQRYDAVRASLSSKSVP